ncbi:conserved unknown protein [Ectocarpus siliculosus]|uniref:Uncharacterized protein n=1 Tax=Ectocarpus siliculosus TaxID=2880 RepID=D8LMA1_ECTSI|nr:conserved unknown protein [Ectocarpus siliculosus]|eukprot:CBN77511.1 conserved unknown protein [Ectocarpus siliculosus]
MSPGIMGRISDGGAILAAMDLGAAPVPAGLLGMTPGRDPPYPGSSNDDMPVQLQALTKIHAQKVRSLMRSVAELKKRLALATAQGKDHRRSAMIRAMRTRLREQDLVVDVIKEELGLKTGMGKEETNDWVIRKTVGGPLRFRPKTREELQNELYRLERKYRQALDKLKTRRTGGDRDEGGVVGTTEERSRVELEGQGGGGGDTDQQASTRELMRLSEALEEVDALRVSVRSRDAALQAQAEAIDQLQLEKRDLRGVQEKLGRKERRARELKRKHANLGEQHTALLEDFEASQEQVDHLKAQLALRKEEALAEADEFREQSLRQAEEVGVLLKREEELSTALEEEVASRQRERREHHHADRQAVARAEAAEKSLQVSVKQETRLREKNKTMMAELQRLGKEAGEAARLRERGRDLAVETKRLAKEAEARQGRLEEARQKGATAEEALRASKESLEAEKSSKEALARETSEMKVLLGEKLALLEAEKKKADDEGEARRRLESMLLAEKKKEEEMGIAAAAAAAQAAAQVAEANAAAAAAVAAHAEVLAAEKEQQDPERKKGGDKDTERDDEAGKKFDLTESEEIIEEMESELREQADRVFSLEEEQQALKLQLESAKKAADDLSAKNAALTAQLKAAPATSPADPAAAVTAGAETEAEPASSRKLEESIPGSPRRPLRPCSSAEEKEWQLGEELVAAKAAKKAAQNECVALKLELQDGKASGDLHKARVKALVADKDSFILDDAHGGGSGLEAAAPTGVAGDV